MHDVEATDGLCNGNEKVVGLLVIGREGLKVNAIRCNPNGSQLVVWLEGRAQEVLTVFSISPLAQSRGKALSQLVF